jgi:hypothetical protein
MNTQFRVGQRAGVPGVFRGVFHPKVQGGGTPVVAGQEWCSGVFHLYIYRQHNR